MISCGQGLLDAQFFEHLLKELAGEVDALVTLHFLRNTNSSKQTNKILANSLERNILSRKGFRMPGCKTHAPIYIGSLSLFLVMDKHNQLLFLRKGSKGTCSGWKG